MKNCHWMHSSPHHWWSTRRSSSTPKGLHWKNLSLSLSRGPLPLLRGTGLRLFLRPAQPQSSVHLLSSPTHRFFILSATERRREIIALSEVSVEWKANCWRQELIWENRIYTPQYVHREVLSQMRRHMSKFLNETKLELDGRNKTSHSSDGVGVVGIHLCKWVVGGWVVVSSLETSKLLLSPL